MILIIDNYDSFVWNLARYIEEIGSEYRVVRSDEQTVDALLGLAPGGVVLSPGPCGPDEAGVCLALVSRLGPDVPLLGVCLGHQVLVQALGGAIRRATRPRHGMASKIAHDGGGLFAGLPSPLEVGRYHSLVAEPAAGGPLQVCARSLDDDEVMAVRHRTRPWFGVQFHPESVLTPHGPALMAAFVRRVRERDEARGSLS